MSGQEEEITKLKRLLEEERKKNQQLQIKLKRKQETTTEEGVDPKRPRPEPKKPKEDGWIRTPPTAHMGATFEMELLALLFLRCLKLKTPFLLTAHIAEFNPFEDILLEYKWNEKCYTYLMQLKHKKKQKTLKHENLHNKRDILDLGIHSRGYYNLEAKQSVRTFFENKFTKWNFVLFSNCDLDDDNTKPDSATEDGVLYFEGGTVHRFKNVVNCKKEPCVNEDCEFVRNIRLFMKQPNTDKLFSLMRAEICEERKDLVHYIALDFTREIKKWYENETTEHLNEQSRNILDRVLQAKCEPQVETDKLSYKSEAGGSENPERRHTST